MNEVWYVLKVHKTKKGTLSLGWATVYYIGERLLLLTEGSDFDLC